MIYIRLWILAHQLYGIPSFLRHLFKIIQGVRSNLTIFPPIGFEILVHCLAALSIGNIVKWDWIPCIVYTGWLLICFIITIYRVLVFGSVFPLRLHTPESLVKTKNKTLTLYIQNRTFDLIFQFFLSKERLNKALISQNRIVGKIVKWDWTHCIIFFFLLI